MERARHAIVTKKGRNAKGTIGKMHIVGSPNFSKNIVQISGIKPQDVVSHNPETNTYKVLIQSFDKNENAASKLLLKMGFESIYESQKHTLFNKYKFSELTDFLTSKNNTDWPFITCQYQHEGFKSIARFSDNKYLNDLRCKLLYREIDPETLLFKFKYGAVEMITNLINRNLKWVPEYLALGNSPSLYPKHFIKKIK
jgi:hypothetical protein